MKKLYRSPNQRILGGVCGGVGEYFDLDPVIVRLVWFVFFLFGGVGLLAYIIGWIIIPLQNHNQMQPPENATDKPENPGYNIRLFWGILLILLGIFFFMKEFWYLSDVIENIVRFTWRYLIPVLLISIGIYVIVQGDKKRNGDSQS